ncbi:MAG: ATP-binding cassette domain-containing protein [Clostridiales bacterium]|jgi:ATP-binding cassette subfamily B protein/subfamily B ATP-binding cassette protein MsbA|nr:ATP-binding cassette domain-containing protein [Clostridiales bacterium]
MSIIIKNLSFAYNGIKVLNNLNLSVKTGEHTGIIGASGGGKSTLLKLISGLYEVQTGSILVNDAETPAQRRKQVAMVMQDASLFPASIWDNITCGHEMSEAVIRHACDAAQLSEWISFLPEGTDTFVGERGGKVSGGQAQRIAIARAIVKNAPVILLDEPTSALDENTGTSVVTALDNLSKGKTVVHVSHRLETLRNCDRILRLEEGRLYDT